MVKKVRLNMLKKTALSNYLEASIYDKLSLFVFFLACESSKNILVLQKNQSLSVPSASMFINHCMLAGEFLGLKSTQLKVAKFAKKKKNLL